MMIPPTKPYIDYLARTTDECEEGTLIPCACGATIGYIVIRYGRAWMKPGKDSAGSFYILEGECDVCHKPFYFTVSDYLLQRILARKRRK